MLQVSELSGEVERNRKRIFYRHLLAPKLSWDWGMICGWMSRTKRWGATVRPVEIVGLVPLAANALSIVTPLK